MTVRRRDPLESAIESALQPGHFIAWNQQSVFVAELEEVEHSVSALTGSDPLRATLLYGAFIAACLPEGRRNSFAQIFRFRPGRSRCRGSTARGDYRSASAASAMRERHRGA